MGKSGKRNYNPSVRPVIRAELSDKNRTLRWILIIGFVALALISFTIGIRALVNTQPGWEVVESASTESNCSADFIFSYCYGQSDKDASAEKKELTLLYSDLSESAYRIFYEGLSVLHENVNQPVTVDPALYQALAQIQSLGNRCLYLAPVYAEYNRIFLSSVEEEAAAFDPGQNSELKADVQELAAFANDPAMIDVELLDNDQVCLRISEEYAAFAQENEITDFLDFGWMVNAFIVDYLARELTDAGFTNGFLSSFDGFTRNLDDRGEEFNLNLFDRRENSIHLAGTMQYDRPISIVFLRDYPMSSRDQFHYYPFSNGRIVTAFIDPADGMSKSATDSLVGFSYTNSCAEVLMQLTPVFLLDSLDVEALDMLLTNGIGSIWVEDAVLMCNDPSLRIKLNKEAGVDYTLQYTK